MKKAIRWGILGPGAVSRKFAAGLRSAEGAELVAVGSRSRERAERFASEFGVRRAHAGYDALAGDDGIDAVYIGTPHSFHREHTVLCLLHGKHVICEKPFALNAAEADEMVGTARGQRRTLMEAMWMRFLPAMVKARALLAEGVIGDIRRVTADFGFRAKFDPAHRLFDRFLGGGALLDIGIYGISLAHMLLGTPARIGGAAHIGATGVDEESTVLLDYENGGSAVLTMSLRADTPGEALILGTDGWLRIPSPWWAASRIVIKRERKGETTLDLPFKANGFTHEAEGFMDCVRAGRLESDVMPLDETLAIMRTMDEIRRQWGMRFPPERDYA
jgi:predicted dehydrogenase